MRFRALEISPPIENYENFKPQLTFACDVYSLGSVVLQVCFVNGLLFHSLNAWLYLDFIQSAALFQRDRHHSLPGAFSKDET